MLADLADAAGAADGPVDLVGYSMGGRMALRTAVDHPHLVRRLVLIGATPGIEDPADRAARAEQDRATAAGHAAHLEAPDDVVRAVLAHLDG